jgi:hypothetical protein
MISRPLSCGGFWGTTTLLHRRVNLFLFLRSEFLDLCTVVRFQLGEGVLKALPMSGGRIAAK